MSAHESISCRTAKALPCAGDRWSRSYAALVCNAEGKLLGLPMNRPLLDEDRLPYDIICGTFFIAGLGQEDFVSLTDEQIQRYKSLYDNMQILPVRTAAGEQGRIVGDQHIKKKGKIDHER